MQIWHILLIELIFCQGNLGRLQTTNKCVISLNSGEKGGGRSREQDTSIIQSFSHIPLGKLETSILLVVRTVMHFLCLSHHARYDQLCECNPESEIPNNNYSKQCVKNFTGSV